MGKKDIKYETFEHIADIGIRGYGYTLEESFSNCAKALFSLFFENFDEFESDWALEINEESISLEGLLVKWLNKLISSSQINNIVFCDFNVKIQGLKLNSIVRGTQYDKNKFKVGIEVKGATFCEAKVFKSNNQFISQCVVDV